MLESDQTILEDHCVTQHPWLGILLLLVLTLVTSLIVSVTQLIVGRMSAPRFFLIALLIVIPGLLLIPWLWKRRRITLTYRLAGSELSVYKTNASQAPLRGYPQRYDLDSLWAAQKVGNTRAVSLGDDVTLFPASLVLVLDPRVGSGKKQVKLRRPVVGGKTAEIPTLERQFDSWDEICNSVQSLYLPQALARVWPVASPYDRFWLVLLQAEVEFLQGQCTAPQMFRATVRTVSNLFREAFRMLWRGFKWVAGFYLLLGAVGLLPRTWPVVRSLVDETNHFTSKFFLLLLVPFCAIMGYQILMLFRPLSAHIQRDASNRVGQSDRLIGAGARPKDINLILMLLKDEIDHIKHRLATLTVATGLPVLFTLMPKFFPGASSWISNGALVVSLAVFAIVQLYYYAQIRILHLAQTNCLIAQGELGKTVE